MPQRVFKRLVDKLQSCYKLKSNKQEARVFNSGLEYNIRFFGWCHNPEKNNDKIWGWIEIEGKLYNFWGRRDNTGDGKSLKFKRHEGNAGRMDLRSLTRAKENKGYTSVNLTRDEEGRYPRIEEVYPNFFAHMKKQLVFARMTGTVRNEAV